MADDTPSFFNCSEATKMNSPTSVGETRHTWAADSITGYISLSIQVSLDPRGGIPTSTAINN